MLGQASKVAKNKCDVHHHLAVTQAWTTLSDLVPPRHSQTNITSLLYRSTGVQGGNSKQKTCFFFSIQTNIIVHHVIIVHTGYRHAVVDMSIEVCFQL